MGGPASPGFCVSEARDEAEWSTSPPHRMAEEDLRGQNVNPGWGTKCDSGDGYLGGHSKTIGRGACGAQGILECGGGSRPEN